MTHLFVLDYRINSFQIAFRDGNISDIGRAGSLHEFLIELHMQHGPIAGFWFGQMYTVSIASPELFKQHSNVFDRPGEE